jgi:hypothetical protein
MGKIAINVVVFLSTYDEIISVRITCMLHRTNTANVTELYPIKRYFNRMTVSARHADSFFAKEMTRICTGKTVSYAFKFTKLFFYGPHM